MILIVNTVLTMTAAVLNWIWCHHNVGGGDNHSLKQHQKLISVTKLCRLHMPCIYYYPCNSYIKYNISNNWAQFVLTADNTIFDKREHQFLNLSYTLKPCPIIIKGVPSKMHSFTFLFPLYPSFEVSNLQNSFVYPS